MTGDFPLFAVFLIVFCLKNRSYRRYRYDYHKELAHVVKRVGKSKICKASVLVWVWRLGGAVEPGGIDVAVPRQSGQREFSLAQRKISFFYCWCLQLFGWGPPVLRRTMAFLSLPISVLILPKKYSLRNTQSSIWLTSWAPCGPLKLTHKIDQHTCQLGCVEGHCLECCGEDVRTWAGIIYWCLSGPEGKWASGWSVSIFVTLLWYKVI